MAAHSPEKSVHRRRLLAEEVPSTVVSGGSLWDLTVWPRLDSVNQIGELDCILDEENRNVVANDICLQVSILLHKVDMEGLTEVTLIRVEPDSKSVYITHGIS
jgi:hypothetical protein